MVWVSTILFRLPYIVLIYFQRTLLSEKKNIRAPKIPLEVLQERGLRLVFASGCICGVTPGANGTVSSV